MWRVEVTTNKSHLYTVARTKTKAQAHDLALKMYYTKSRPSWTNPDIFKPYAEDENLKVIYITDQYGNSRESLDCTTGRFVKGGAI